MSNLRIALIGCGNIGTHMVPELPRLPGIAEVTLCDPDRYTPENHLVQAIDAADIGRAKAVVQAERLRRVDPSLKVNVIEGRVEDAPRGLLKCDLILSCLDSRSARQHVNELATRLGVNWIDSGILGSQGLARVNAYVPGHDTPCLECGWAIADYAALETEFVCGAVSGGSYPSMASSPLGAVAASLMAVEAAKILNGDLAASVVSRQVILDVLNFRLLVTASRRNPWCRFDHRTWHVEPWECSPEGVTLGAALGVLGSLRVEGHRFVTGLQCPDCGRRDEQLRLNRPLTRCPECDRRMVATGIGTFDRLDRAFAGEHMNLTLAEIGLRTGDIITGGDRHHRIQHRMLEAAA
jgi:molybdopterin/thiamine biosynthesis adenylyltransferase